MQCKAGVGECWIAAHQSFAFSRQGVFNPLIVSRDTLWELLSKNDTLPFTPESGPCEATLLRHLAAAGRLPLAWQYTPASRPPLATPLCQGVCLPLPLPSPLSEGLYKALIIVVLLNKRKREKDYCIGEQAALKEEARVTAMVWVAEVGHGLPCCQRAPLAAHQVPSVPSEACLNEPLIEGLPFLSSERLPASPADYRS